MNSLPVVANQVGVSGQSHVTKAPSTRKTTPPLAPKNSREERKERMREKREQQRLKKMAQSKLGELSNSIACYAASIYLYTIPKEVTIEWGRVV